MNCGAAGYGVQLFTDLPPVAAVTLASSNFTGSIYVPAYAKPIYNTVTDEVIEVSVPEKNRAAQS